MMQSKRAIILLFGYLFLYLLMLVIAGRLWQVAPFTGSIVQYPVRAIAVLLAIFSLIDAMSVVLDGLRLFRRTRKLK